MKKDAYAQEWLRAEKLVRRYGLPLPKRKHPEVREALAQEIARPDKAGHALLRALSVLLWSAQSPADALLIAEAKFLNMDAGSMVDGEFLLCGPETEIISILKQSKSAKAATALSVLGNYSAGYNFSEKLAAEQSFYGIEAALPEADVTF